MAVGGSVKMFYNISLSGNVAYNLYILEMRGADCTYCNL